MHLWQWVSMPGPMALASSTFGDSSISDEHLLAPKIAMHKKHGEFRNPPDAKASQRSVQVGLINYFIQNFENNWEVLQKIKTTLA